MKPEGLKKEIGNIFFHHSVELQIKHNLNSKKDIS